MCKGREGLVAMVCQGPGTCDVIRGHWVAFHCDNVIVRFVLVTTHNYWEGAREAGTGKEKVEMLKCNILSCTVVTRVTGPVGRENTGLVLCVCCAQYTHSWEGEGCTATPEALS